MPQQILSSFDPTIEARVLSRWPLLYSAGADVELDRPAHVRAGSGLTNLGDRLALIQDDANFVAIVDPVSRAVDSITLPALPCRQRQFDDLRGNRLEKLDLEACTSIREKDHQLLVALGSGSTPSRERIMVMKWPLLCEADICLYHAPIFYQCLRSQREFAGSELNLEGVAFLGGDVLRLFQRGNGAPRADCPPVNATCDVVWSDLRSHLHDPSTLTKPFNFKRYDLGELEGVRLTFTDGSVRNHTVYFTATAEASPDAIADGPVMGSVIGRIGADVHARYALILDEHGNRLAAKVEGLTFDSSAPNRGWISIDADDPTAPSELCEIELSGDWEDN